MFGGVGLAAVPGGYDEGAVGYWKRRELEDSQAALQALGNYALTSIPGSLPMPGGLNPGAGGPPPGSMPSGVGTPAGGGPAAVLNQPGGMPPRPPGMMPGPPGMMPGGPPPGFVNPLSAGGQPQNLTGGPIALGGNGAQQSMGAPPPAPMQPGIGQPQQGGPPPGAQQMVQRLGPPPPGGYDWRQVVREIAQANPKADPAVIARAAMMMMPLMNQQAQMELRMLNMQLAQERIYQGEQRMQLQQENMGLRQQHYQDTTDLSRRRQDEVERENRERDRSRSEGLDLRRDRYQTLAEQARRRLDQRDQQLLDQKEDKLQRAKDRASALAASGDKAARRDALNEWKNAMEDYHRSIRERIGAAGILDKKTRDKMDAELREQEAADKAEMGEAERRYKARLPEESGATPQERSDARDRLRQGLQAQQGVTPPAAGPDGIQGASRGQDPGNPRGAPLPYATAQPLKPIPQAQLPQLQQLIQKYGRDAVIEQLRQQGFDPQGL